MRTLFMSLVIAGIALLASCGGGGSSGSSGSMAPNPVPTTTQPPTSSDPTLPQQVTVGSQMIWETKGGLPLYTFNGDTNGVSNCTGSCATIWPPLMAGSSSKPTGAFTIISRMNPSGSQWAYNGKALYTFASDKPGAPPTGNGFQGFSVAVVSGQPGGPTPPPGCMGPYC